MKKFNFWTLLALIPVFLGAFIAFSGDRFYEIEKAVFDAVRILSPAFDIQSRIITELGSAVGVVSLTVIVLIVTAVSKKYFFNFGLPVAITSLVSRIVNITAKISSTVLAPILRCSRQVKQAFQADTRKIIWHFI